jgi:hypothetical protein
MLDADLQLLCLEFHALRAIETAPVHASDGIDVEAFFQRSGAPACSHRPDPGDPTTDRR